MKSQIMIMDLIQTLCNCGDNQNMALLSAVKDLIELFQVEDLIESSLENFSNLYITLFNDIFDDNNKTQSCLNIISRIIDKLHEEENFEGRNYNESTLKSQSFENESKKEFMIVLFMDYFETINASIISKIIFGSNILIKECTLCHSISYNFEIQKIFKFNVDEIIDYKSKNNNNEETITITLDDCFKYFTSPKNNNDCKCKKEGCNCSSAKITKLLYWTNNILIIYLYRPSYEKVYKDLDIQKTLDLSKYLDKDSLKNLIMVDNKLISYIYELSSIFYFDGNGYICSCRKNKNEELWYHIFNGLRTKKFSEALLPLTEFENYQPVLLFYEYKISKNNKIKSNAKVKNKVKQKWVDYLKLQYLKEI